MSLAAESGNKVSHLVLVCGVPVGVPLELDVHRANKGRELFVDTAESIRVWVFCGEAGEILGEVVLIHQACVCSFECSNLLLELGNRSARVGLKVVDLSLESCVFSLEGVVVGLERLEFVIFFLECVVVDEEAVVIVDQLCVSIDLLVEFVEEVLEFIDKNLSMLMNGIDEGDVAISNGPETRVCNLSRHGCGDDSFSVPDADKVER
jgi:hypothetical protein